MAVGSAGKDHFTAVGGWHTLCQVLIVHLDHPDVVLQGCAAMQNGLSACSNASRQAFVCISHGLQLLVCVLQQYAADGAVVMRAAGALRHALAERIDGDDDDVGDPEAAVATNSWVGELLAATEPGAMTALVVALYRHISNSAVVSQLCGAIEQAVAGEQICVTLCADCDRCRSILWFCRSGQPTTLSLAGARPVADGRGRRSTQDVPGAGGAGAQGTSDPEQRRPRNVSRPDSHHLPPLDSKKKVMPGPPANRTRSPSVQGKNSASKLAGLDL